MGYWLKTQVTTPESASMLYCFIYFDSTFLASATLFSMMHALGYRMGKGFNETQVYAYALGVDALAGTGNCRLLYQ